MMSAKLFTGSSNQSIHKRSLNLWNQVNPWLFRTGGGGCLQPLINNGSFGMTAVRFRSNRSRRGLYDGKDIRSGNNVSFSMKSTKRKFKPNVVVKRLFSEILDEIIMFRVTTSALRTMDKLGGLDNYLLQSEHITEGTGLEAKRRILKKLEHLKKHPRDEPNPFLGPSLATDDIATESISAEEEPSTSSSADSVTMKE